MDLKTAEVPLFQQTCVHFKMRQFHSRLKSVCVPRCVTKVSMHLSISHSLCSAVHNYDSLCGRSSRSPIMLSILLVGRAGASPPSRTAAIIFLYIYLLLYIFIYIFIYIRVVRRALNLLRASFSPIFQYFSAVNVTRVSFSQIFQYFLNCMPWRHAPWIRQPSHGSLVHSHRDFRVRRSVVYRDLNWLIIHNQYYRSNHVHIDVNALEQLP